MISPRTALVPLLFALTACTNAEARYGPAWMFPSQVRGSGIHDSLQRTFEERSFERLEVDGSLDVAFEIDAARSDTIVFIEGDDDLIGKVIVEARGDALFIAPESGDLRPVLGLTVKVLAPRDVEHLALRGSGDLSACRLDTGELSVELYGSGDVELEGRAESVRVRLYGSGDVQLEDLASSRADVLLSGSGDVVIHAERELVADIRGSGNVEVLGDPAVWRWDVHGSGEVRFRDPLSSAAVEAAARRERR